ncbi:MAG TPA: IPT/TIG domain-containing protein, partial [Candidatus Solibacter sp.]|nr:IPT/TIG domain-containing protein [Candidatus Solibacter sp.]
TIQVTQPAGTGTVDIRVTNEFGTSAVTSADQFAAPTPVAPTVVSVTPIAAMVAGTLTYQVQIIGTGFVIPSSTPTSVSFGAAGAGTNVTVVSLTEMTVTPPSASSGTLVDVQVTNDLGTSAVAPPGDQFLFGTPIVTGLSRSSGPAKGSQPITITGLGFVQGCTVTFNFKKKKQTITPPASDVTPTSIQVTPPDTSVAATLTVSIDVTVTNPGPGSPESETTPNDLYMYYSVPKKKKV